MMSLASKSGEIIIFIAVVLSLTQSSPVPPSLNTAGTPNTQCTINPPQDHGGNITLGQMKSLACLLEATVMEAMKSPSIPSFDMFRPENQPNDHAYVTEVIDTCQCQTPSRNTSTYQTNPKYNIDPHITVRYYYDPRITNPASVPYAYRQYLPEDVLSTDGVASPVTSEWILKDHINSLRGFVSYFIPAKTTSGGDELESIARTINDTILPLMNFEFSNECPHDERVPNFNGFPNDLCEMKCASWHLNWTLQGLYYTLGNQVIYPPAPPRPSSPEDNYPELAQWQTTDCCSVGESLFVMPSHEYRNMTCAIEMLSLEAYALFEEIGQQTNPQCSGVSTVTGIKTWTHYMSTNQFPPLSSSSQDLYIYGNHFEALAKNQQDVVTLYNSPNIACYSSETRKRIEKLMDIFNFVLPSSQQWMLSHNCPGCSTCTDSSATLPNPTPLNGQSDCTISHKVVSCLAIDINKIAESAYLFLDMRTEATPTWTTPCSQMWTTF